MLRPGGVYPYHYAIFNQVTEQDFGVNPPEQSAVRPPGPGPSSDPWSVVSAYYADVNASDYSDAWNLMSPGQQAKAGSYQSWVDGYIGHNEGQVSEVSQSGDIVNVTLSKGSWCASAWYQVDNGLITDGHLANGC